MRAGRGIEHLGKGFHGNDGEGEAILRESPDFPQLELLAILNIQITVNFKRLH